MLDQYWTLVAVSAASLLLLVLRYFGSRVVNILIKDVLNITAFRIKEKAWKLWYNYLSRGLSRAAKNNHFSVNLMNWGYHSDKALERFNNGDKESFKKCLYSQTLSMSDEYANAFDFEQLQLQLQILEVSCGRGGGMKHLLDEDVTKNKIKHFTGLDLCEPNVNNCAVILSPYINQNKASVVVGSALDLSALPANHFNIVLNVESSHCYVDFALFVQQVHLVLKMHGLFCFTDFRTPDLWTGVESNFIGNKWKVLHSANITGNVLHASAVTQDYYQGLIARFLPRLLHGYAQNFTNAKGSRINEQFSNGSLVYKAFCIQKISE